MTVERIFAAVGLLVFIGFAYLISENRKAVDRRILIWGLGLQVIFAVLVLGIPTLGVPGLFRFVFDSMNTFFLSLMSFSDAGAAFVFGSLADEKQSWGFLFAFKVLPTIIFFSTLVAIFYHLGILQRVVFGFAWIMKKLMPIGGAESLSTSANIFLGQTEAPLLVKPFIATMTRSELLCIMVGGMANVAGGVMMAFIALLHTRVPDIAGHLLTVSILSAPATILISKLMIPERPDAQLDALKQDHQRVDSNLVEAATRGASEGLMLALNIAAMLIAFIAVVAMVNGGLAWVGNQFGLTLSLELFLSWLFAPVAVLLGIPFHESSHVAGLLGEKIILNEFVAFIHLADLSSQLSDRTMIVASYALCGFANIASIGIQVGGIGAMAPERRGDLAQLGVKALIGGNLATFVSATVVSLLI